MKRSEGLCWIHLKNIQLFLRLGVNPHESQMGQNITVNLSLQLPYRGTQDEMANTVDYGEVIKAVQNFPELYPKISLIEYFTEKLLLYLGKTFPGIHKAKVEITKGYLPLENFHGSATLEAEMEYSGAPEITKPL